MTTPNNDCDDDTPMDSGVDHNPTTMGPDDGCNDERTGLCWVGSSMMSWRCRDCGATLRIVAPPWAREVVCVSCTEAARQGAVKRADGYTSF